ncbi:DUF4189 domain-containing protein [Mycolicibacterium sarraceniae]|uniref:DUF4189 domain-containing protein n=1 Tax=Mycolicibacterium sarraceniae TaxID=1534348 RepID=A0A7I7SUP7_9MYCO|nr:DUF4189 domain-containing protein [Mycolicibacterium sarraceniae]BBY59909.1 hypothetical protein MSAR_30450 [Mycolicibacterium sarraceniae]
MASTRLVSAIVVGGVIAAAASTGIAWAGGPDGGTDNPNEVSEAVGTGAFLGVLEGFRATGATNGEASARVIAACEQAGGIECSVDEVTNENLCIVSVADDGNSTVAGGAGPTVEAARQDALQRAAANGTPFGPGAGIVISACP